MLKLTYAETELQLERLAVSLEEVVAQRAVLALRLGRSLYLEVGRAAFLLAVNTPGLSQLEAAIRQEAHAQINLSPVDEAFVEVSLQGSWLADCSEAETGIFLATYGDRIEFFIHKLWLASQSHISSLVQIHDG
jgi:hypothetical protein